MEVINIYKCFCDTQRLRILNLLQEGPLCVCHLMEILGSDQVKMSKQLRYMKDLGVVNAERQAQWMVYSLPEPRNPLLVENLKCLQDVAGEALLFASDLKKRSDVISRIRCEDEACPDVVLDCCGSTGCGEGGL